MPESDETPPERVSAEIERPTGGSEVAAARMHEPHLWVDLQVKQAMERGEFDDLPGAGRPIEGLGTEHDPEWWLKKLVEREKISVLPPALALRKEDLELDARLDRETTEAGVVKVLEEFNNRIVAARRQLEGGPPVVTPLRDVEAELIVWRERREARRAEQARALAADQPRRRFRLRRRR